MAGYFIEYVTIFLQIFLRIAGRAGIIDRPSAAPEKPERPSRSGLDLATATRLEDGEPGGESLAGVTDEGDIALGLCAVELAEETARLNARHRTRLQPVSVQRGEAAVYDGVSG